ncbi:MAG: hypothetical protein O4753_05340 [Trichodesmium sp. St7_bin2_1]|nr:hypothetical protein [Trichodesmium sp. St7_bin2_1]
MPDSWAGKGNTFIGNDVWMLWNNNYPWYLSKTWSNYYDKLCSYKEC